MDPYLSDEERVQQIKEWWKKNGNMLLLGIGIGLLIMLSWIYMQNKKVENLTSAATRLENLQRQMSLRTPQFKTKDSKDSKDSEAKTAVAIKMAKDIIDQYPSTPYATDAMLLLAKLYVEKANLEAARTYLETALLTLDASDVKYHVARIRLARLLRDSGAGDKALAQLNGKSKIPEPLKKYYEYIKGTVYEDKKQCQMASTAYQAAIKIVTQEDIINKNLGLTPQTNFRQMVEHRLENVRNC